MTARSLCGKCGRAIGWRKTPSGKWQACEPDGSDHWDICRETVLGRMTNKRVMRRVRNEYTREVHVFGVTEKGILRCMEHRPVGADARPLPGSCDCAHDVPPWEGYCAECPVVRGVVIGDRA